MHNFVLHATLTKYKSILEKKALQCFSISILRELKVTEF